MAGPLKTQILKNDALTPLVGFTLPKTTNNEWAIINVDKYDGEVQLTSTFSKTMGPIKDPILSITLFKNGRVALDQICTYTNSQKGVEVQINGCKTMSNPNYATIEPDKAKIFLSAVGEGFPGKFFFEHAAEIMKVRESIEKADINKD